MSQQRPRDLHPAGHFGGRVARLRVPANGVQGGQIGGVPYWDGGYLGNPALSPLLDCADDLLLVLVNAFHRDAMPPRTAPAIMDRLNEITFNAPSVLEINAIRGDQPDYSAGWPRPVYLTRAL